MATTSELMPEFTRPNRNETQAHLVMQRGCEGWRAVRAAARSVCVPQFPHSSISMWSCHCILFSLFSQVTILDCSFKKCYC